MKEAIKGLLESKKFIAAMVAVLVWGIGLLGVSLPPEQVAAIVSPIYAYILGQAYADGGKEKAKVEAAAAADERVA